MSTLSTLSSFKDHTNVSYGLDVTSIRKIWFIIVRARRNGQELNGFRIRREMLAILEDKGLKCEMGYNCLKLKFNSPLSQMENFNYLKDNFHNYFFEIPKLVNPMLKLLLPKRLMVYRFLRDDDLTETLVQENDFIKTGDLTVDHILLGDTYDTVLISVKPELRLLMEETHKDSLCILGDKFHFFDNLNIRICSNCISYGHKARNCRNCRRCTYCLIDHESNFIHQKENYRCGGCGCSGHFINCIDCPELINQITLALSRVNYGYKYLVLDKKEFSKVSAS